MDQLAKPIGYLMRPTFTVDLQDSLELAARKLRENGCGLLPVTENGAFSGAVTESGLAMALAEGRSPADSVESVSQGTLTARPSITGAEALRLFGLHGGEALVVIDDAARVLGIVTPSDLFPKPIVPPRPPLVGGMATPFGVYLTTGSIRAGVSQLALVTTGMVMFGLLGVAIVLTTLLTDWLSHRGLSNDGAAILISSLPYVLFLLGMRLIPLSGIHAAEHKVVHAIERGEELVPATVKRMPRVHPRCGTNLAVGVSLLVGIGTAEFLPPLFRILLAAIVTLLLWKPLGNMVQYYVTTKRPSDRHIEMGIKSGTELLNKYALTGGGRANIGVRILNSGMLHVIAGSVLALGVIQLLVWAFHLPIEIF